MWSRLFGLELFPDSPSSEEIETEEEYLEQKSPLLNFFAQNCDEHLPRRYKCLEISYL